jgi:hypothetical protein
MEGKLTSIDDCQLITFDKIESDSGSLSVLEPYHQIPFDIKRVYYIYDIPSGSERGGHAHKTLHQVLIAISGSFDLTIFDGVNSKTIQLNRPNVGVLLVPGIWRKLSNFSSSAVCLTLASQVYNESDYIREPDIFSLFKES